MNNNSNPCQHVGGVLMYCTVCKADTCYECMEICQDKYHIMVSEAKKCYATSIDRLNVLEQEVKNVVKKEKKLLLELLEGRCTIQTTLQIQRETAFSKFRSALTVLEDTWKEFSDNILQEDRIHQLFEQHNVHLTPVDRPEAQILIPIQSKPQFVERSPLMVSPQQRPLQFPVLSFVQQKEPQIYGVQDVHTTSPHIQRQAEVQKQQQPQGQKQQLEALGSQGQTPQKEQESIVIDESVPRETHNIPLKKRVTNVSPPQKSTESSFPIPIPSFYKPTNKRKRAKSSYRNNIYRRLDLDKVWEDTLIKLVNHVPLLIFTHGKEILSFTEIDNLLTGSTAYDEGDLNNFIKTTNNKAWSLVYEKYLENGTIKGNTSLRTLEDFVTHCKDTGLDEVAVRGAVNKEAFNIIGEDMYHNLTGGQLLGIQNRIYKGNALKYKDKNTAIFKIFSL